MAALAAEAEPSVIAEASDVIAQAVERLDHLRKDCDRLYKRATAAEDRAWELECALKELLRDESERRCIGGGPGWKERHAKSWAAAYELFDGEPL